MICTGHMYYPYFQYTTKNKDSGAAKSVQYSQKVQLEGDGIKIVEPMWPNGNLISKL